MKTIRITVAQALVRFLAAQYTARDGKEQRLIAGVWGIFGHGNVAGLGQALEELGSEVDLRYYRSQNEQAQVHAATAFAKHTNRLSTFACTASVGPGSTNMITGAALATINRLPVLLLPSDFFANRVPDPVLQQVEHPTEHDVSVNDCFRSVSRFYSRISRADQLIHALPEAMRVLTDPAETGAVVLSLPQDVQTEAFDFPASMFEKRVWRVRRPQAESELIAEATKLLQTAKKPVIVCGGGVKYSEASSELASFAEAFGVPITETQAGKGAISWDHPMNVGPVGAIGGTAANTLTAEADLIIAIGTRLGDFTTGSKTAFPASARIIGINITPMDAHKHFALPIVADARRALSQLHEALNAAGYQVNDGRLKVITKQKSEWDDTVSEIIRVKEPDDLAQAEVIGLVNDIFTGDAVMINAAGSMPGDLIKLWRPTFERSYHLEYGFSCMGYEIPAGIGVKLAEPSRRVVVMIGDGSYLMLNSEIVTAVTEGLDLTIVIVDNHGYQSIHGLQRSVGSPSFGNELRHRDASSGQLSGDYVTIDFAAHAASMGANAVYTRSEAEFKKALTNARDAKGVQVVVVEVNPEKRVGGYAFGGWWDTPVAEVSEQPRVQEARQQYDSAKQKQVIFKEPV
jgi:3D-(3,5/4)-trihydroxycyclohexane-1,2-dione acylhydrolase (decyclizing)